MAIPKVCGIETEWSVFLPGRREKILADVKEFDILLRVIRQFFNLPQDGKKLDWEACDSEAEKELLKQTEQKGKTLEHGGFLPNGARIYVDYPHLEYSTPECLSIKDLIAADNAGNRILEMAAKKTSEILGEKLVILKDNSDRKGHSFASHENYLMDRKTFDRLMENSGGTQNKIIAFLVSRQILAGGGKIGIERGSKIARRKSIYQISQRADFINEICGSQTTDHRNIINTRDEPHADAKRFARLHLILGDANFCQWSLFLRVGTTVIVLKMLEDGFIKNQPIIDKPVKAIKTISRDPACRKLIKLIDGKRAKAIDIQEWYLEQATRYFAQVKPTDEEKEILEKWAFVLKKLRQDPTSLVGYLDWPTKEYLINRTQTRLDIAINNPKLQIIDVLYHDIDPARGLYFHLLKSGKIKELITDEQIEKFVQNPPEDTRAYLRGLVARQLPGIVRDWDKIYYQNETASIAQNRDLTLKVNLAIILENPLITREKSDVLFNRIRALISTYPSSTDGGGQVQN